MELKSGSRNSSLAFNGVEAIIIEALPRQYLALRRSLL